MDYIRITYGTPSILLGKHDMEKYAHTAKIFVIIFATDFNMSDNGVNTLAAKFRMS